MDQTQQLVTINIFLDYIYNKFGITFLMCLLGLIIGEYATTVRKNHKEIKIVGLLLYNFFITSLMCALLEYRKLPISIYFFICILIGMWGKTLIKIFTNIKIVNTFIKHFAKGIGTPISKAISETVEETEKEIEKEAEEKPPDENDEN